MPNYMPSNLVKLAEEYCLHFHESQRRKGSNQPPYSTHPFAVRDILVKYGYSSDEYQCVALLHDTIEDTALGERKNEIEKRFGKIVYQGVYVLSTNTSGKHAQALAPLFADFGVDYMDEKGHLTKEAYKLRLLFARESIKIIKIADMTHNSESLPDLKPSSIERKIRDAITFYIPLGRALAPIMVKELEKNIANYQKSGHYQLNLKSD